MAGLHKRDFLGLLAAGFAWPARGETPEIHFANDPFPPYVLGKLNEAASGGIAHKLHREIFRRVDARLKLDYQLMPWARALLLVERGQIDAMMFLFRTKEREQIYDYTDPLLKTPLVVFYSKRRLPGGLPWADIKDLAPLQSVVTRGASYGTRWDEAVRAGVLSPQETTTPLQTILMTASGRVDFTPMNLYTGLYFIQEQGLADQIGINEAPIHFSDYHMAFSKLSPHRRLVPAINKVLEELRAEKYMERLLKESRDSLLQR